MNDDSSKSRSPRQPGANSDNSTTSLGEILKSWLRGIFGGGEGDLRESLEDVIEEHGENGGLLDPEQRTMLSNILGFGELQADDIMVPRADIVAIDVANGLAEVMGTFREGRHSRLPVYGENLDQVIGFIHIKDILDFWSDGEGFSVAKIVREPLVVPPSMPALDLLERMRATRIHMALVVDEYGGVDGLITIEDVVEEIVGEIEDEHDEESDNVITALSEDCFEADARVEIEVFESRFGVDLLPDEHDEDIETLGGAVVALLGRLPRTGERVRHPAGFEFEVVDADPRRIKKLRIHRAAEARAASAD